MLNQSGGLGGRGQRPQLQYASLPVSSKSLTNSKQADQASLGETKKGVHRIVAAFNLRRRGLIVLNWLKKTREDERRQTSVLVCVIIAQVVGAQVFSGMRFLITRS